MALLLQVLGVLAAAALLRVAAGSLRLASAVALIAVVLGTVAVANDGWSAGRNLLKERAQTARLTAPQVEGAGGTIYAAREDVLGAADARIPDRARVYVACVGVRCGGSGVLEWITFRLTPRPFVERMQDADWVLGYGMDPAEAGIRGAAAQRAIRFGPKFFLYPRQR